MVIIAIIMRMIVMKIMRHDNNKRNDNDANNYIN